MSAPDGNGFSPIAASVVQMMSPMTKASWPAARISHGSQPVERYRRIPSRLAPIMLSPSAS
jgi:hypothetical protein